MLHSWGYRATLAYIYLTNVLLNILSKKKLKRVLVNPGLVNHHGMNFYIWDPSA